MSGTIELATLLATMEPELSDDEMVFCSFADTTVAERHGLPFHTVLRAITLTVHSSLEAVGLTAAVAGRLALHEINANIVAGYFHDHIFVRVPDAERALQVLRSLQAEASQSPAEN